MVSTNYGLTRRMTKVNPQIMIYTFQLTRTIQPRPLLPHSNEAVMSIFDTFVSYFRGDEFYNAVSDVRLGRSFDMDGPASLIYDIYFIIIRGKPLAFNSNIP